MDFVHGLRRARQVVAVRLLERGHLAFVAEQVLTVIDHQHVRHLREAVIVLRAVRIGGIGRHQVGMQVREHRLQARVGVDELVDLHVVAALDVGAQPLAVADGHLVLLLARGQRGREPRVVVGPRDEVDHELHGVAGRRLVARVRHVLHDARRRPVGRRQVDGDVLGLGRASPHGGADQRHRAGKQCRLTLRHDSHADLPCRSVRIPRRYLPSIVSAGRSGGRATPAARRCGGPPHPTPPSCRSRSGIIGCRSLRAQRAPGRRRCSGRRSLPPRPCAAARPPP